MGDPLFSLKLPEPRKMRGQVKLAGEERVTVETWVYLSMIVTELRKAAGDRVATLEVANRLQAVANANRK